jgi:hypothetical protein
MKQLLSIACIAIYTTACAHGEISSGCQSGEGQRSYIADIRFTEQERIAWDNRDQDYNAIVRERFAEEDIIEPDLPDFPNAMEIPWNEAKRLVWMGSIKTIWQRHDLTVYLLSNSGNSYVTVENHIDEIFHVMRRVDPCGLFIVGITQ